MKYNKLFITIITVAALVRLVGLEFVPAGYTWDEAAITYDGWGIADWHRDQYATFMPLTFKSFGDYKAPLMIYTLATIFKVIGVNDMTIRIVSAISGTIMVATVYFLAIELFPKERRIALYSSGILALSPWHIHMSRIGFEANTANTLLAIGLLALSKSRKNKMWLFFASVFTTASMYTYHSTKITAPLLVLVFSAWLMKKSYSKKYLVANLLVIGVLSIPLARSLAAGSSVRASQALVIYNNASQIQISVTTLGEIISNTARHLSSNFLVLGKENNLRGVVPNFGIMYYADVVLLILGFIYLQKKNANNAKLFIICIIIGFVPSILSKDSPHAIRSANSIPWLMMTLGVGVHYILTIIHKKYGNKTNNVLLGLALVYLSNVFLFAHYYTGQYRSDAALDFQYGYKQALLSAKEELKTASKIVVTDHYGQPYVYTLLYFGYTPEQFQQGALANASFHPINWPSTDLNTIFVATPTEIPPNDPAVFKIITKPDSDIPVFVLART